MKNSDNSRDSGDVSRSRQLSWTASACVARPNKSRFTLGLLLSLLLAPTVQASIGDSLPEFQDCIASCNCQAIPFSARCPIWSCSHNCDYHCQQLITNELLDAGGFMVQFYGKWPFRQVLGMQEFCSVVFSLGNLAVNWANLKMIRAQRARSTPPNGGVMTVSNLDGSSAMYWQYMVLLVVSCLGWLMSVIFHIRDTPLTESLDYFGAFAMMCCNLNVIVVRILGLYRPHRHTRLKMWHLAIAGLYVYHVVRLRLDWDYDYNMKMNITVGMSAMLLWCMHSLGVARAYSANRATYQSSIQLIPYESKLVRKLKFVFPGAKSSLIPYVPIINTGILLCGVLLEVNDFRPWFRLVDAHSLWHLLTIFPNLIWFDWNVWDIEMSKITEHPNYKKS
ncbi:uncharacterized protein LODBEIA_P55420 [Lodderomyces beijingensis]|uniref:Post-GPI attachment to proteins factor 3 n=1 Tax=Lodderomyces beijingensis TaxID=1775926 RepID=A0ABP0ZT60_9ASCO